MPEKYVQLLQEKLTSVHYQRLIGIPNIEQVKNSALEVF